MINYQFTNNFQTPSFKRIATIIDSFGHYMKIGNWKLVIALFAVFILFTSANNASAASLSKPSNNLGLIGYWSFEDATSTKATDFSGNGNTGTLTNMAAPATATSGWGNGKRGQALSFDGTNDYVNVGDVNSVEFTNTDGYSISTWVYPTGTGFDCIISRAVSGGKGWYLTFDNGGGVVTQGVFFDYYDGSTNHRLRTDNAQVPLNQWSYITLTKTAGTNVYTAFKLYVNGVNVTTGNYPASPSSIDYSGTSLEIGSRGASSVFQGKIDEVRIYSRELSTTEVGALYNAGGGKLKQSSNSGLIGYWSFEDATSTKATDFSGNGKAGTLTNGPTWTNGKFGKALDFDGSNDRVLVGTDAYTDAELSTTGSLMGWFKLDALPSSGTATGIFDIEGYLGSQIKNTSGNTRVNGRVYPGGEIFGTTNLSIGVWYHYALTWTNSSTMKLYLNAVEEASGTAGGVGANAQSRTTVIGDLCDVCGTAPFNGSLDELRLYNRVLTQAEIASLYQNGAQKVNASQNVTGTTLDTGLVGMWSFNGADISGTTAYDRSGQGNNGTLTNGPKPTIGKAGQALSFDGSDDYMTLATAASLNITSDITLSTWIKTYNTQSGHIVGGYQAGGAYPGYGLGIAVAGGNNGFITYYDGTHNWIAGSGATSVSDGNWHHVVVSVSGTTASFYKDGVSEGTATVSSPTSYSGARAIGGRADGGQPYNFPGLIDEVRIYNRALSANEVKQLYNMGK